jgi:hypothetical protein
VPKSASIPKYSEAANKPTRTSHRFLAFPGRKILSDKMSPP